MKYWSKEFVSEIIFSKYYNFNARGDVINPKLGRKGPKLVFHVSMVIERWKSIVKEKLRWGFRFWKHCVRILKFWPFMVTSSSQKWIKKVQIGISCTNIDRKMKVKNKRNLQVKYSFMKRLSQYFEVLTQCSDIINPKLARKRAQTCI